MLLRKFYGLTEKKSRGRSCSEGAAMGPTDGVEDALSLFLFGLTTYVYAAVFIKDCLL